MSATPEQDKYVKTGNPPVEPPDGSEVVLIDDDDPRLLFRNQED